MEHRALHRTALVVLQLGALAVVLAASPYKAFELDRFFIPKELVLHATALLAALLCIWRVRVFELDRVDTLLVGYVTLSLLSAVFAANWSLASRAATMTLSGVAIFWTARAVAGAGFRRPLIIALVAAVVVGALGSLLQAYGLETEYASLSRAPGGTFGNRNFMAHLCAIGAPLLVWCTVTSKRAFAVGAGVLAAMLLGAALVLSRTRAAWVALAVCAILFAIPTKIVLGRTALSRAKPRLALLTLGAALGVVAAIALPNRLNWKSDSPYLDSMRGVVDYSSGSGRGRVIQYTNTLHMAAAHPVLGVGPGNWPVYYPRFAAPHDPSLNHRDGRPANPWPSSDWMALIAERGVGAALLFVLVLVGVFVSAWLHTGARTSDPEAGEVLAPLALSATLVITAIVGAFDAVLLLAGPTLIVWAAFGALSPSGRPRVTFTPSDRARRRWIAAGVIVGGLAVAQSAAQLQAMASGCDGVSAITLERCRAVVQHRSIWQLWRGSSRR